MISVSKYSTNSLIQWHWILNRPNHVGCIWWYHINNPIVMFLKLIEQPQTVYWHLWVSLERSIGFWESSEYLLFGSLVIPIYHLQYQIL